MENFFLSRTGLNNSPVVTSKPSATPTAGTTRQNCVGQSPTAVAEPSPTALLACRSRFPAVQKDLFCCGVVEVVVLCDHDTQISPVNPRHYLRDRRYQNAEGRLGRRTPSVHGDDVFLDAD